MAPDIKNASPAEWKAECERIAQETGVENLLKKRELKELPSVLETDERVLAFTAGFMDKSEWLLTLTDRRILFLQKKPFGLRKAVIDLDNVTTIIGHKGLYFKEITICNGSASRVIESIWENTSADFTLRVRMAIAERKRSAIEQKREPEHDNSISRLVRLDALFKRGLLTREEYESERNELLQVDPVLKRILENAKYTCSKVDIHVE